MATYANLLIIGVNGAQNSTVDGQQDRHLLVNENTGASIVIGKITGFAPDEDLTKLVFTAGGEYGDAEGRYEIVRATAAMAAAGTGYVEGDWVIVLKDNGAAYDHESASGPDRVSFTVSTNDGSPLKSDYGVAFDFTIMDVNEAPDHLTFDGRAKAQVEEDIAGGIVGVLGAIDEDDLDNAAGPVAITYEIVAGVLNSDLFEIVAGTNRLKLVDGATLDWDAAPNVVGDERYYELVIRVTDSGGYDDFGNPDPTKPPASRDVTVKVYVTQDVAPDGIEIDGGAAKTVAENTTEIGVMTADDASGIESFTVEGAWADVFEVVKNAAGDFILRVKDARTLDYEALADKTITLQIRATDSKGTISEPQAITITVEDINEKPVLAVADEDVSIGVDAEDGDTVVAFTSSDQDAGTWGALAYTLTGAGVPADLLAALEVVVDATGKRIVVKDADALAAYEGQTFSITLTATDTNGDAAGLAESVTFDLTVDDGAPDDAPPTINDLPVIDTAANGAVVSPFAGMTVTNEAGQTTTMVISFAAGRGTLGIVDGSGVILPPPGGDATTITYTFTGTADELNAILDNLTFDPSDLTVGADAVDTAFTVTLTDDGNLTPGDNQVGTVTVHAMPPDNVAPTGVLLSQNVVREYSLSDVTVVGTLSAVDPGDERPHGFVLMPGGEADGLFRVEGSAATGWRLVVAKGVKLDYESKDTYQIHVKAIDDDGEESAPIELTIFLENVLAESVDGTDEAEVIKASTYDDLLNGGGGNDTLYGGGGADFLEGGVGEDQFVFSGLLSPDKYATIRDFNPLEDKIVLDSSVFEGIVKDLVGDTLMDGLFYGYVEGEPLPDVQIIYDEFSGSLFFDPDGLAELPMVLFAVLENAPPAATLDHTHFLII